MPIGIGARAVLVVALGLGLGAGVAGCKGKAEEKGQVQGQGKRAGGAAGADGDGAVSGRGAGTGTGKAGKAEEVKGEAKAFLDRWVEAQKKLDFEAYAAMYEPRTFRGVKRTSSKTTEFDFAGWKKDRQRMFQKGFEVAAEPMGMETWLDPGSKLKSGMIVLRFIQRWRSAKYADHGLKVLHVWRAPDGAMKITYEDLLNSEKGWERVAPEVDVADLPVPKDEAAALALWKKLAPTGADYEEKLASIPADEAVRRPMARALLAGGNFECQDVVRYEECGNEYEEWADFDVKATFDDACLRRRLALWALGEVEPGDLAGLDEVLVAMARLEKPEDELPQAVAAAVSDAAEPLRLAVIGTLVAAGREEDVSIDGLSEEGLVKAAVEHGVDEAAGALHEVRHLEELAALLGSDGMADETRAALLDRLDEVVHPKVTEALIKLTDDDNCQLAMEAALALDRRGDPSHLPQRSKGQSIGDASHAICMLLHDPDDTRAEERLAAYIGPDGVQVEHTIDDPWAEDAGPDDEPEPPDEPLRTVDEIRPHLEAVLGEGSHYERAEMNLAEGEGGPVIRDFEFYSYNGCGC